MQESYPRIRDICLRFQISRPTWYAWIARGIAPKPIKFGRASRWDPDALRDFEDRVRNGQVRFGD
jgi:predicted DNA-binding transcriptional regulator AlpA